MAEVNKVEVNGETLIDLTHDTVTASTLDEGVTAHDATGRAIVGGRSTANVQYTPQQLTAEQKAQARENIGAAESGRVLWPEIPNRPFHTDGNIDTVYWFGDQNRAVYVDSLTKLKYYWASAVIPTYEELVLGGQLEVWYAPNELIYESYIIPFTESRVVVKEEEDVITVRNDYFEYNGKTPNMPIAVVVLGSNKSYPPGTYLLDFAGVANYGLWKANLTINGFTRGGREVLNAEAVPDNLADSLPLYVYEPTINDDGVLFWDITQVDTGPTPEIKPGVNIVDMVIDALDAREPDAPEIDDPNLDTQVKETRYTVEYSVSHTDFGDIVATADKFADIKEKFDSGVELYAYDGTTTLPLVQIDDTRAVFGSIDKDTQLYTTFVLSGNGGSVHIIELGTSNSTDPVPWTQVSGKPFHTVKSNTLVWDGDLTGKEQTFESLYVKLSDVVLTEEDLSGGGRIVLSGWPDDAPAWVGITSAVTEWSDLSGINFVPDMGSTILPPGGGYAGLPIAMLFSQDYTLEDGGKTYLLTPGIYVFRVGMFYEGAHVSEFTVNNFNGFEREVIKKSALPDDVTLRTDEMFVVTITYTTTSGSTTHSADKTYAEIKAAYDAGAVCVATYPSFGGGVEWYQLRTVLSYGAFFVQPTVSGVIYQLSITAENEVTRTSVNLLKTTGGTLTGALKLHGDPTAALHAATKQYVDAATANTIKAETYGTEGQIALSDGAGGVRWEDIPNLSYVLTEQDKLDIAQIVISLIGGTAGGDTAKLGTAKLGALTLGKE